MPEFLELVFKHEGREKGGFFKCLGSRNFSLLFLFGKGGTKRLRKPLGSMYWGSRVIPNKLYSRLSTMAGFKQKQGGAQDL